MSGRTVPKRIWWLVLAGVGAVLVILPARWVAEVPRTYVRITEGEAAVDALIYQHVVPESLVPLKQTRPKDWSQRWPIANVPRHPLDLIASSSKPEPRLKAWIEAWQQAAWAGSEVGRAEREDLLELLTDSGLSALALLEGGQSFDLAGDGATAATWFGEGVFRSQKELAELPANDPRVHRLADVLIGVQGLMWEIKNAQKANQAQAFEAMMRILVAVLPEGDEQRGWAIVGVADSLIMQQEYGQAVDYLDRVDPQQLRGTQPAGIAWARARALWRMDRPAAALAAVEPAVQDAAFHHRQAAASMRIMCLARVGEDQRAIAELRELIRNYHLSPEEAYEVGLAMKEQMTLGSTARR